MTKIKKPRGYFEKVLCLDCETSGLFFSSKTGADDPSFDPKTKQHHQALSWGFIVADLATLQPVEKLYMEIKWDGESEWNMQAQNIHGLTKEHLQTNGITEEEAIEQIAELVIKYWGPTNPICTLGHNSVRFDIPFLQRQTRKFGINFNFANRHIDTNTLGMVCWNVFNSDDLFSACGLTNRTAHNALEDIEMTLEAARRTRMIFDSGMKG